MISPTYTAKQISGVWAMAFNLENWQDKFQREQDDVFRSFWAIIFSLIISSFSIIYMPNAISAMGDAIPKSLTLPDIALIPNLAISAFALVLHWLASLAILVRITPKLSRYASVYDTIIGFNWAYFLYRAGFSSIIFLMLTGYSPLIALTGLPIIIIIFTLLWGMFRRALPGAQRATITGLVIVIMLFEVMVGTLISPLQLLFTQ